MTTFRTFASGSSGNAAFVQCGNIRLLIDIGISCRRLCQALAALELKPENLTAILISHEHSDHIKGLATYSKKYTTPIICTPGTARQLTSHAAGLDSLIRPVPLGESISWPGITVDMLPTSHDAEESAAFRLKTPDGQIGILTDTGYIPEETGQKLLGADLLVLESNHDGDLLWSGPYPYRLKARIQSKWGHLSNTAAARFAAASVQAGTKMVLLSHLSRENNTPQLALHTAREALEETGCQIDVAPKDSLSAVYCLENSLCGEWL